MTFQSGLLITVVTDALISSHHIFTNPVRTNTASSWTLIYILTGLFIGSKFMSCWTNTFKGAVCVYTSTSSTKSWSFFAFVDVWKNTQYYVQLLTKSVHYLPIQTCIILLVLYPSLQSQTKSPGIFLQSPFPQTPCIIVHSSISTIDIKLKR